MVYCSARALNTSGAGRHGARLGVGQPHLELGRLHIETLVPQRIGHIVDAGVVARRTDRPGVAVGVGDVLQFLQMRHHRVDAHPLAQHVAVPVGFGSGRLRGLSGPGATAQCDDNAEQRAPASVPCVPSVTTVDGPSGITAGHTGAAWQPASGVHPGRQCRRRKAADGRTACAGREPRRHRRVDLHRVRQPAVHTEGRPGPVRPRAGEGDRGQVRLLPRGDQPHPRAVAGRAGRASVRRGRGPLLLRVLPGREADGQGGQGFRSHRRSPTRMSR